MRELINLKNIKKKYTLGEQEFYALKGIDLEIPKGQFLAIVGESGSGKSTLLNILGALDTPSEGKYLFEGKNVGELKDFELADIRNEKIGFIFQSFNLLPKLKVIDNVMLPFLYSKKPKKGRRDKAIEILTKVGLGDKIDNRPNQLSGGQIQRVAIARSLVLDPKIILADEPTGNLDSETTEEILALLNDIRTDETTIILITHSQKLAKRAERIVTLKDGLLVKDQQT